MVPLVPLLGARWPRTREHWRLAAFVGLALFAGQYALIYWGELRLDSGLTAIVFSVYPLLTALGAHAYLPGERATVRKLAGTLLALAGVATLFAGSLRVDASLAVPILAIVAAAACAALGTVATKRHARGLHPASLNAPAMLIGAAALLLLSWLSGESPALPREAGAWTAILYLALAGSVVTFLLYFWLLQSWAATTLSLIAVIVPIVALVLGFVFLGERPTLWTFAGAALVIAGVTLSITRAASARP